MKVKKVWKCVPCRSLAAWKCFMHHPYITLLNEKRSHPSDCEIFLFLFHFFKPRAKRYRTTHTYFIAYTVYKTFKFAFVCCTQCCANSCNLCTILTVRDRSIESNLLCLFEIEDTQELVRCTIAKYDGGKETRERRVKRDEEIGSSEREIAASSSRPSLLFEIQIGSQKDLNPATRNRRCTAPCILNRRSLCISHTYLPRERNPEISDRRGWLHRILRTYRVACFALGEVDF